MQDHDKMKLEKKSGLKTFENCWKWSHTSSFRFLHIGTQNASQMNGQIRSGIFTIDLTHPLTIVLDYLSVSVFPLPCFDTVLVFACLRCGGIHSPFKRIKPKSCKTRIMIAWSRAFSCGHKRYTVTRVHPLWICSTYCMFPSYLFTARIVKNTLLE